MGIIKYKLAMLRTLRALTIDDNETDVLLMARMLRHAGYDLEYVRVDNAEAMRAALDQKSFDVFFIDHGMPRFSDLAALAVLGERGLKAPCILVSGVMVSRELDAAMRAGAHDFVPKQNLAQLGEVVGRVIRRLAG